MADNMSIESLDVMEPKMLIHDELKVIYINEAFEEALQNQEDAEKKMYDEAKASNPDYVTRLRRMPLTLDFMKEYAALRKDSYMIDLIKRKEPVFEKSSEIYEMSLFDAFKNAFIARNPECRNVYKAKKHVAEYKKRHGMNE